MGRKLEKLLLVGLMLLLSPMTANAVPILTQTPQGGYQTNILGGSAWTTFTAMMTAEHAISSTADFSDLAELLLYDAVWVDQELTSTLGAGEISALISYASAGNKVVLIGENDAWTGWNASLMSVTGGALTDACSWDVGTPLIANSLTAGVGSVQNACGSLVSDVGGVEMLFDNNMAGLYGVGAGEVLVILDSNWNDNTYMSSYDNQTFAANVVSWLGIPIEAVPEPGTLALLGLGLVGMAARRRKKV